MGDNGEVGDESQRVVLTVLLSMNTTFFGPVTTGEHRPEDIRIHRS
jgi:hypothetical protein